MCVCVYQSKTPKMIKICKIRDIEITVRNLFNF